MKLCKANVTKVLKRAGFEKAEEGDRDHRGFHLEHGARAFSVEWWPYFWSGTQETRDAEREEKAAAMTSALSPYWTVTPIEGGLQLSETAYQTLKQEEKERRREWRAVSRTWYVSALTVGSPDEVDPEDAPAFSIPVSLAELLVGMTEEQLQEAADLLTCWKAGEFSLRRGQFNTKPAFQWIALAARIRVVRPTRAAAIHALAEKIREEAEKCRCSCWPC